MPITYSSAIDELFGIINSIWPDAAGVISYVPEIRWPGAAKASKPDTSKFWARVSTQTVDDGQSSLANVNGQKRYRATCLLYVQIFCPRNVANALPDGRLLAQLVRDRFLKSSPSGALEFQNQKIRELPAETDWYPINVVVTYIYDEISPASVDIIPELGLPAGSIPHAPVEAFDGVRTTFTFLGLPLDQNQFAITWNGLIQADFVQAFETITLEYAPVVSDVVLAYF
jgi:hypothetical protein